MEKKVLKSSLVNLDAVFAKRLLLSLKVNTPSNQKPNTTVNYFKCNNEQRLVSATLPALSLK